MNIYTAGGVCVCEVTVQYVHVWTKYKLYNMKKVSLSFAELLLIFFFLLNNQFEFKMR